MWAPNRAEHFKLRVKVFTGQRSAEVFQEMVIWIMDNRHTIILSHFQTEAKGMKRRIYYRKR